MQHARDVFRGARQVLGDRMSNPIPDDAWCECGFLKRDYPGIGVIIDARHMPRAEVGCRCEEDASALEEAARRLRWDSNLPHPDAAKHQTFNTFKAVPGTADALQAAWDFANGFMSANVLVLIGGWGTGKTSLLEAIGRVVLRGGGSVRYEVATKLLDRLRAALLGQTDEGIHALMEWYESRYLLILDDIEHIKVTDMGVERIGALVDQRCRDGAKLVIATNVPNQAAMADALGPRVADRLWDANTGVVKTVVLTCESYRTGIT